MGLIGIILSLLLTGVIEFRAETFTNLFVAPGKSRVMNLINMEQSEAEERLANIGLKLEIIDVAYSNDVLEGRIISQEEKKGEVVDEGTSVHVVVSMGAATVQVPSVIDVEIEESKNMLNELKLEYEIVEEESIFAPGYIFACKPDVGADIEQGQTVTLYVSTGIAHDLNDEIEIRDYVAMDCDTVRNELAEHGVYLIKDKEKYDDNVPVGMILSQNVAAGETVKSGSIISVEISKGIEQKEVPELVGMQREEAEKILADLNLTAVVSLEYNEEVTPGQVVCQSVSAKKIIDKYSEIIITVATDGYVVPNLSALTKEEAENICRHHTSSHKYPEVLLP